MTCNLNAAVIAALTPGQENQFRITLAVQTNTNNQADYITFYPGESTVSPPLLILTSTAAAVSTTPSPPTPVDNSTSSNTGASASPAVSPSPVPDSPSPAPSPDASTSPTAAATPSTSAAPVSLSTSSSLGSGPTAGIAIGVIVAVIAVIVLAVVLSRRSSTKKKPAGKAAAATAASASRQPGTMVAPVHSAATPERKQIQARLSSDTKSPLLMTEATGGAAVAVGGTLYAARAPTVAQSVVAAGTVQRDVVQIEAASVDRAAPVAASTVVHSAPAPAPAPTVADGASRDVAVGNTAEHGGDEVRKHRHRHHHHRDRSRSRSRNPDAGADEERKTRKRSKKPVRHGSSGTPGYDTVQEVQSEVRRERRKAKVRPDNITVSCSHHPC